MHQQSSLNGLNHGDSLPRGPVLGWSSFERIDVPGIFSIEHLAHTAQTTSGRAAIYQALLQLQLPPGSTVLVPTYHCPTMVAPVLLAHLSVAYFGIQADGLPNLATINATIAAKARAILVPHYFGLANSLAEVRQWCDARRIFLIEDCAHCYFGDAGERRVGDWGDYATASVSKFLPVPEGGLLASARHPIQDLGLAGQGLKAQVKGWIDVLELATRYRRIPGLNSVMSALFALKHSLARSQKIDTLSTSLLTATTAIETSNMMRNCDMARIDRAPLGATNLIRTLLPRGRIIARRQRNFAAYANYFARVKGARPLYSSYSDGAAPYVLPLWVDDAERVYREIRTMNLPVFRWDRIWPGTPLLEGDVGPLWSQHVLQLLCHQDLSEADVRRTALAILKMLEA